MGTALERQNIDSLAALHLQEAAGCGWQGVQPRIDQDLPRSLWDDAPGMGVRSSLGSWESNPALTMLFQVPSGMLLLEWALSPH